VLIFCAIVLAIWKFSWLQHLVWWYFFSPEINRMR
jgi:hypothetical protein